MKKCNWLNKIKMQIDIDDQLFKEWILQRNRELIKRLRTRKQRRAMARKKDL